MCEGDEVGRGGGERRVGVQAGEGSVCDDDVAGVEWWVLACLLRDALGWGEVSWIDWGESLMGSYGLYVGT